MPHCQIWADRAQPPARIVKSDQVLGGDILLTAETSLSDVISKRDYAESYHEPDDGEDDC